jgi:molybdopterin/thiamine biosynthesis adenylyltransferase
LKKILIVGAGGIGSWLAANLYDLICWEQLPDSNVEITIADDDHVEAKNISYQNFEDEDIMDPKAAVLHARYGFKALEKRITDERDLYGYDCIVSAVDNPKFRRLLFEYCHVYSRTHWIDLRSEGRTIAAFTTSEKNTLEKMLDTLGPEDAEDGSCQLQFELDNDIIQQGNKIVAVIGSQYILNWHRFDTSPPVFSFNF